MNPHKFVGYLFIIAAGIFSFYNHHLTAMVMAAYGGMKLQEGDEITKREALEKELNVYKRYIEKYPEPQKP